MLCGSRVQADPPPVPEVYQSEIYSSSAAEIFWYRPDEVHQVIGYDLYRNGRLLGHLDALSYFDDDIDTTNLNEYRLVAVNRDGEKSVAAEVHLSGSQTGRQAVPPATGITLAEYAGSVFELFWQRSPIIGLRYDISRNGEFIGTTDGTSYFDDKAREGTCPHYRISTVDKAGRRSEAVSVYSQQHGCTSEGVPATPPETETAGTGAISAETLTGARTPVVQIESDNTAKLFWEHPEQRSAIAAYEIWRNDKLIGYSQTDSFTDTRRQSDSDYHYRIVPVGDAQMLDWYAVDTSLLPIELTPSPSQVLGQPDSSSDLRPPWFEDLSDTAVHVGEVLDLTLKARDHTGDVAGQYVENLPADALYLDNGDGTKSVRWQPALRDAGIHTIYAIAVDPDDPQFRTRYPVRIQVIPSAGTTVSDNRPPTIDAVTPAFVQAGDFVNVLLKIVDADGHPGRILALNLPVNAHLARYEPSPESAHPAGTDIAPGDNLFLLQWQTGEQDIGEHLLRFNAIDALDPALHSAQTVKITISPSDVFKPGGQRLRSLMEARNRAIGFAAIDNWRLQPDRDRYHSIASTEFNIVTPENAMKWAVVNPDAGIYDWRRMDEIVALAQDGNMQVHGHPLVWHRLLPRWVNKLPSYLAEQALTHHIEQLVSRYRDSVDIWDVVNEALDEDGSFRQSIWYRSMGPQFLDIAFATARQNAPAATLLYNDYDIARDGPKAEATYRLVSGLIDRGVPIDGVGFQMHLDSDFDRFDQFAAQMARYADLGLDVYITELDVPLDGSPDYQAQIYRAVVEQCLAQSACRGIQTWGLTDRHSWKADQEPLLFDRANQPKPAYRAIQQLLTRQ